MQNPRHGPHARPRTGRADAGQRGGVPEAEAVVDGVEQGLELALELLVQLPILDGEEGGVRGGWKVLGGSGAKRAGPPPSWPGEQSQRRLRGSSLS